MSYHQPVIRKEIINLTCEFLETWLNQILYQCNIYPKSVFKTEKKFEMPVQITCHSGIKEYIANFVQSCHPLLQKDELKQIALTVISEVDQSPIKKFVFGIRSLINSIDIPLELLHESESVYSLVDLEQHLRACLVKLHSVSIDSREDDLTFFLSMEIVQNGSLSSEQQMDWIPAPDTDTVWGHILPLKSHNMDLFRQFTCSSSVFVFYDTILVQCVYYGNI
ncbi:DNA-binding protein [Blakeslea trispora]|nr:DNA-binding protein [Blakeslea trispora]